MDNAKTILLAEHDPFLINIYTKELRKLVITQAWCQMGQLF